MLDGKNVPYTAASNSAMHAYKTHIYGQMFVNQITDRNEANTFVEEGAYDCSQCEPFAPVNRVEPNVLLCLCVCVCVY